ncbi:hypothetical protein [Caballeronia sp. S22]
MADGINWLPRRVVRALEAADIRTLAELMVRLPRRLPVGMPSPG